MADGAITVSIDKLISTKVLKELKNNLVAKRICTLDTGSQINKKGDQVTFVGLADPTVRDYNGTIQYEDLDDAGVTLVIDQQKYVAFNVDDIEAFRSSIDIKGTQVERSGYKLKDVADKYVLNLAKDESITNRITATGISEDDALQYIAKIRRKLDEANVPFGQAFCVIDPMVKEKLELAGIKFGINEGMKGFEGGLEFADYLGMKLFVSNNVATKTENNVTTHYCLAGSFNAIVYADQIVKSRYIPEAEGAFEGKYSALHVYGAKILKPAELVVLEATE